MAVKSMVIVAFVSRPLTIATLAIPHLGKAAKLFPAMELSVFGGQMRLDVQGAD